MPKLSTVTPKKLVKVLISLGFFHRHSVGSHQVFKHLDGRRTVVSMHNREIRRGTLLAILDDIKVTREQLVELL